MKVYQENEKNNSINSYQSGYIISSFYLSIMNFK